MRSDRLAVAVALIIQSIALSPTVPAAPLFYLSDQPLGLAQPGTFSLDNPADAGGQLLYIYGMTDERLSGVSLDLSASGGGIEFSGLNVVNDGRWWMLDGPQVVEHLRISSIGGGAIPGLSGNGIGPGDFVDPNYHPSSGYLLATVEYNVVDASGPLNFELTVGQNAIADWNGNIPMVHLGDPLLPAVPGASPPPPRPLPPAVEPPAPANPPTQPDPIINEPISGLSAPDEWIVYQPFTLEGEPVDPLFQNFYTDYWPGDYPSYREWQADEDRDERWTVGVFSAGYAEVDSWRSESSDVWGFAIPGGVAIDGLDQSAIIADELNAQLAAKYEIASADTGAGLLVTAPVEASILESDPYHVRKIQEFLRNSRITGSLSHFTVVDGTSVSSDSAHIEAALASSAASAPEPSSLLLILSALAGVPPLVRRRAKSSRSERRTL